MKPEADVYKGNQLVAHLTRTDTGTTLQFLVITTLSSSLPFQSKPLHSNDLHPFFLNLLPEGARLDLLLKASRNRDDLLELLMKLGWDTIGDIAILPHRAPLAHHSVSVPQSKLEEVSFWDLFYEGISNRPDASVPGVQEKISSSTIAFGIRTENTPSAILKLNPTAFPRLVQNEEYFLLAARNCGVEAVQATIKKDRLGEFGLLVPRFDRVRLGKSILKLHQEDACQLLDIAPANKYKVSMRSIADKVQEVCTASVPEMERLLKLYAFSYLIGNGDLHAKNISLLWTDGDEISGPVRLSPAYDLLSTLPYPMDQHMALKLDGKDNNFRIADFVAFGSRYRVPQTLVVKMLQDLCHRLTPWIGRIGQIGFDTKTTERVQSEITRRIEKLNR